MVSTEVRKPRFERRATAIPGGFRVTERDEEIMLMVARHRIVRSTHITGLIQSVYAGGSEQGILRRLEGLYHTRYLSRPPAQLETYRAGAGSRPIAYMLGNRSADLLARKYAWRRAAVDWTAKARTATRGQIEHAIEITDFMVALDVACRRRGTLRVMYFDEILQELAPQGTRETPRPYHWPVSTNWQGGARTLYVIPDRIFGIRDLTRRGDRAVKFFAYERDRGTMPVVRSNLAQSSIVRKLIGYGATHRAGLHTAIYGLPNFRVLTEAPGRVRAQNMITEGYQRHLSRTYPQDSSCLPIGAACSRPKIFSSMNGSMVRGSRTACSTDPVLLCVKVLPTDPMPALVSVASPGRKHFFVKNPRCSPIPSTHPSTPSIDATSYGVGAFSTYRCARVGRSCPVSERGTVF